MRGYEAFVNRRGAAQGSHPLLGPCCCSVFLGGDVEDAGGWGEMGGVGGVLG